MKRSIRIPSTHPFIINAYEEYKDYRKDHLSIRWIKSEYFNASDGVRYIKIMEFLEYLLVAQYNAKCSIRDICGEYIFQCNNDDDYIKISIILAIEHI